LVAIIGVVGGRGEVHDTVSMCVVLVYGTWVPAVVSLRFKYHNDIQVFVLCHTDYEREL